MNCTGANLLLGNFRHADGQPRKHPFCHRRGGNFENFHFLNFFVKTITSFAAMALPNWRHLELAIGLVG